MNHIRARQVFEEIQARPYRLCTALGDEAQNCYFKGIELLQKLGAMGYTVRGRIGETYWDRSIIPIEIVDLLPKDILTTHFFVEALIDDEWRVLDPSFQPILEQQGFKIGSFKNGGHCFDVTKLYSFEEGLKYQELWFDPAYQKDYFERGLQFWRAADAWFQDVGG